MDLNKFVSTSNPFNITILDTHYFRKLWNVCKYLFYIIIVSCCVTTFLEKIIFLTIYSLGQIGSFKIWYNASSHIFTMPISLKTLKIHNTICFCKHFEFGWNYLIYIFYTKIYLYKEQ